MTQPQAEQLAKEIDAMVTRDQRVLMEIVFGAARVIATAPKLW